MGGRINLNYNHHSPQLGSGLGTEPGKKEKVRLVLNMGSRNIHSPKTHFHSFLKCSKFHPTDINGQSDGENLEIEINK